MDAQEASNSSSSVTPAQTSPDVITKAVQDNILRQKAAVKKQVVYQICHVCNIELAGQSVIDSHMAGSKHAKKLKAQELLANLVGPQQDKSAPFRCEACNVSLNSSTQFEVHCAGAKHKSKVGEGKCEGSNTSEKSTEPTATVPATPLSIAGSLKVTPDLLHCAVCDIHVNSSMQLEQHLNSKKHRERESGRKPQRSGPYSRPSMRGGRGGLGSHGRGGKIASAKFTSLSSSFKSAGYSNAFIKPEGGVIMPNKNSNSINNTPHLPTNQVPNPRGPPRNKGNFGSLSPYVNAENHSFARGGFNSRGSFPRGGWHTGNMGYGPEDPNSGYGDCGYDYGAYDGYGGYHDYNMMHAGPPGY